MMRRQRIFWQIYPTYLLITLLSLTAVFFLSTRAFRHFYLDQTAESLRVQALIAEGRVREPLSGRDLAALADICRDIAQENTETRLTLILTNGIVVGDTHEDYRVMENHATESRPEIMTALRAGRADSSVRFSDTLKQNMMYVAVPVFEENHVSAVVRTSMPVTAIENLFFQVQQQLIFGAILVLGVAALLSLLVSRRIVRPLERMRRGADRFAEGDFSRQLPRSRTVEVNALADALNQMATQLEDRLDTVIEERNQREAVLSSMVEGVAAVDPGGSIISLNKAAAEFFDVLEPENAAGRSLEEVFRNERLQKFTAEVLQGQETQECEMSVGPEPYYLQVRGTNLYGSQGDRIGAVFVFNNITNIRKLENMRRDFVANVSHEIKTPITSIKGFAETLLDGAIKDKKRAERFLRIAVKHADRLTAIIDDLLVLSRLEQQGDQDGVQMSNMVLAGIVRSAVAICAKRAKEKNIKVKVDCPEDIAASINAPLLEQALINLLSNAIKYSEPERDVKINVFEQDGCVVLSVVDQGFGIEEEHLSRLFERFYRVDKGRSRQEGGTGLGLAIVKHIAQAHGGTVDVQSVFGEGSVFSIYLPKL